MSDQTLLLSRADVKALVDLDACIDAVTEAFRAHGEGRVGPPGILGLPVEGGGFHIKAGRLDAGGRRYFVAKTNANFMGNRKVGEPSIRGVVLLCDAERGRVLALMDSIEITILRTGAATAVAARYLSGADAAVVTVVGCGNQGRVQLRALCRVRPIARAFAYDIDGDASARFAREMARELEIAVVPVAELAPPQRQSDVWLTCSPAREILVWDRDVAPGAFVAAVGADSEEKQELDPALLARATVVVDVLDQCATIGDLHHALRAGVMTRADVHAELGEIVAGRKPGRRQDDETIVFDSTGMALQDAAAAVLVYQRALAEGHGTPFAFA